MKKSWDNKVVFNESNHTYKLGEKYLKSVTTLVSEFKPKFDKESISLKYAKKHGLKQIDVLEMWEEKGKAARDHGTFVHKCFEDYINGNIIEFSEEYYKSYVARDIISDFFESGRLTPVETEFIVYNDNYAGQIDCIAHDKNNNYYIIDWKTNSEIKTSNIFQNMLPPYDHLPDCSFIHYSMQLSIYKKLIKKYKIKDCFIVHLMDREYNFIKYYDLDIKL